MVGPLTARFLGWLPLAVGLIAVTVMIYSGGMHRGVLKEAAAWKAAVEDRKEEVRAINWQVNQRTMAADSELRAKEEAIRDKWRGMGKGMTSSTVTEGGK